MQLMCNVNDLYKIPWPFNAKEWQNSGHRTCIPSWMHSTVVRCWIVLEVLQVLRPQPHILIHGDCSLCYCHGSTYSLRSLQFSLFQTLSGLRYRVKRDEKKGTLSKIQASYNQYLESGEAKGILPSVEWGPDLAFFFFFFLISTENIKNFLWWVYSFINS